MAAVRRRISKKRQVALPASVLRAAGLHQGDVLEVERTAPGVVTLRRTNPFLDAAGALTGVFPKGHLDELRKEWEPHSES